jgi:hypothetical protein
VNQYAAAFERQLLRFPRGAAYFEVSVLIDYGIRLNPDLT